MRLDLLKRILICSSAFKIWRKLLYLHHEGRLCCCRRVHDKVEQLPPYFECALSNFRDILNAHRAALGASLMSQEQKKNTPQSILNEHRADLIHIEYPLSVKKK